MSAKGVFNVSLNFRTPKNHLASGRRLRQGHSGVWPPHFNLDNGRPSVASGHQLKDPFTVYKQLFHLTDHSPLSLSLAHTPFLSMSLRRQASSICVTVRDRIHKVGNTSCVSLSGFDGEELSAVDDSTTLYTATTSTSPSVTLCDASTRSLRSSSPTLHISSTGAEQHPPSVSRLEPFNGLTSADYFS